MHCNRRWLLGGMMFFSGLMIAQMGVNAGEQSGFTELLNALKSWTPHRIEFAGGAEQPSYPVFVHNSAILPLLKNRYDEASLDALFRATADARRIGTVKHPWGAFIQAASFASEDKGEATNYDAVWVRDSIWGIMALKADPATAGEARDVLLSLWDYMLTPPQRKRLADAIWHPTVLDGENGQMLAVHIRFNSRSATFDDVEKNGKPQFWNHKQNDALALLLDATLAGIADATVTMDDLRRDKRIESVVKLFAYLETQRFYAMEDSGAWEELARLNTSSVALATSAFAGLVRALRAGGEFAVEFEKTARALGVSRIGDAEHLSSVIDKGYERIFKQLAAGGESPDYPRDDPRYRESDAALLNLIYPANLDRLTLKDKYRIMELVEPLAGDYGVRRYADDDYQSGNFWFDDIKTDVDPESFAERKKRFIPGSEAQWFFDSWCAVAWLRIHRDSSSETDLYRAMKHANRAFGQITGGTAEHPLPGADGLPAPAFSLPESYNLIVNGNEMLPAPSPITPLNWAKASMTLMFKEFEDVIKQ